MAISNIKALIPCDVKKVWDTVTLVVKVVVSKTLKLLLHSFRLSDDTPYLP